MEQTKSFVIDAILTQGTSEKSEWLGSGKDKKGCQEEKGNGGKVRAE